MKRGEQFKQIIDQNELKQLESWTSKKCGDVVFDSDKDNWNQNTSVFDSKVMNRSNLMFVIEDTNNNKFGCYLPVKIDKYDTGVPGNKDMFLFSLKSNGRIDGMMKFEWKQGRGYYLPNKSHGNLIYLGSGADLGLRKQNHNRGWINQNDSYF